MNYYSFIILDNTQLSIEWMILVVKKAHDCTAMHYGEAKK